MRYIEMLGWQSGGEAGREIRGKKMEKSNENMIGGKSKEVEEKVTQQMWQVRMAVLTGFSKRRIQGLKLLFKVES